MGKDNDYGPFGKCRYAGGLPYSWCLSPATAADGYCDDHRNAVDDGHEI
jgi:hypothetical protein